MNSIDLSHCVRMHPSGVTSTMTIISQFFIPTDTLRYCEVKECLRRNVALDFVKLIILFNEREYTTEELGLEFTSAKNWHKVVQVVIGRRLMFSDVFQKMPDTFPTTLVAITNIDIFFDQHLQVVSLDNRDVLLLSRIEYRGPLSDPRNLCDPHGPHNIIVPRYDMQDAWVFSASGTRQCQKFAQVFDFEMGHPGCDNKLAHLFKVLGYNLFNHASFAYHFHTNGSDHSKRKPIPQPWSFVCPFGIEPSSCFPPFGMQMSDIVEQGLDWTDNAVLGEYIAGKLAQGQPFIIPRVAGIENNVAVAFAEDLRNMAKYTSDQLAQMQKTMKSNAGVSLPTPQIVQQYARDYIRAFANCELYTGWEIQGNVYAGIAESQTVLRKALGHQRQMIWANALNIFNYIFSEPWTQSLKGKRLLIVSAFAETMEKQVRGGNMRKAYDGVDLFPDCTFTFIKPPMGMADSHVQDYVTEMALFRKRLDKLRDKYDVALVSCGGIGNAVCDYIFTAHKKSAVYVGGVLAMYFGILGKRWEDERADIVKMFVNGNDAWTRPADHERPNGFLKVENGAYW